MSTPPPAAWGSSTWSAERSFKLLTLVSTASPAVQRLFLRTQRPCLQQAPQVSDRRRRGAPSRRAPAPAQAQTVPKPMTARQAEKRAHSRFDLRQKHLARKMWASVRIAQKLLAWQKRSWSHKPPQATPPTAPPPPSQQQQQLALPAPQQATPPAAAPAPPSQQQQQLALPAPQQATPPAAPPPPSQQQMVDRRWAEIRACIRTSLALPAPPQATPPAAPAPPSQQQLVAAARAGLDATELQDHRGSKRSPARTPPPKAAPSRPPSAGRKKKVRGGESLQVEFAAAAPPAAAAQQPYTATTYHAAALAHAANPHHPLA